MNSSGAKPWTPWTAEWADLPRTPGAYLLLLELDRSTKLPDRFGGRTLPPGCYLYAGSARGSGGIRARCKRHLSPTKNKHWHVDWLTTSGHAVCAAAYPAAAYPNVSECDLLTSLLKIKGVTIPELGFGSSDCRRCPAHLVGIMGAIDLQIP